MPGVCSSPSPQLSPEAALLGTFFFSLQDALEVVLSERKDEPKSISRNFPFLDPHSSKEVCTYIAAIALLHGLGNIIQLKKRS